MAGAVRRIGAQERRARLALRHHLAPAARADGVVQVARDLVGLHGTDPASVFLAAAARLRQPEVAAIERALYHDRVLLRMLGMRRTMFVVPVELAPIVQAACTDAIAAAQRRLLLQLLAQSGIAADDPERWLAEVEEATVKALAARGQALASELAEDDPRLREQILLAEGKSYAARQSVVTRVLLVLAAEGRIARGRPRGSWISGQYRWSLIESWLPGGMAEWSAEAARAQLVRRWLAAFGPGTMADLRWWTGLQAGQVKRALAAVGAVEVDLDGVPGLVLADDLEPAAAPGPWVALLPALDPTVMGWSERGWYLGDHGPTLFDRNGNAGPTVWWDGRVVGGWASRKDGEVVFRLLEDVGAEGAAAVEAAAGRLAGWLGPVQVTPRFRTPLERELSA
jgi:hypothetical protein